MRDEVRATLQRLMTGLQDQATGANGGAGGAGGRDAAAGAVLARLKEKLRNAIGVMQEGLVERDAEVRRWRRNEEGGGLEGWGSRWRE